MGTHSTRDSTGWFEAVYANANHNPDAVPWANLSPYPEFIEWAQQNTIEGNGRQALVVGCGLGDDAEALANAGFDVTAFDISPTAIKWCRERFPDSDVAYQVADLFETDGSWQAAFDFVLEVRTVQSLPPPMHEDAMKHVAGHVAPGGTLLAICKGRLPETAVEGPPWPLTKRQLEAYQDSGLQEVAFAERLLRKAPPLWTYRAEYHNPHDNGR